MHVPGWLMTVAVLMSLSIGRALAGETATAVATITAGFVSGITVTSGGSGYTVEPKVTLSGGGGSGATAKAILSEDKVAAVVVLTAGTGYSTAPTVVVEPPPKPLGMMLELVPKLTVVGPAGSIARVKSAADLTGPWKKWTNVVVAADGTVLVDLSPGPAARFYRAFTAPSARFVWIEPGTFLMGSPTTEPNRQTNETQHTVTLTQGFWMSEHEVTHAEYQTVMGDIWYPSNFRGENLPVDQVSWDDAEAYCKKLTERERFAGRITPQQAYRLPTEAEWEYAARAGTTGARYGDLDAIAWYDGNANAMTHPVKQKVPNIWGLHEMLGNVMEYCEDLSGEYPTVSVTDPKGPSSGIRRVARGGNYYIPAGYARFAFRSDSIQYEAPYGFGFRPVLSSVR